MRLDSLLRRWFERMSSKELKGDCVTYTTLINACAKGSDATAARGWLQRLVDEKLQPNVVAYSAALKAHGEVGRQIAYGAQAGLDTGCKSPRGTCNCMTA